MSLDSSESTSKRPWVSVGVAYTERRENHGTMILQGVSYSSYTLRYGSYCTYGIAPSSQSSLVFYGLSCDVYLGWYLRPIMFPQCYVVNTISSIHHIFPRLLTSPLARVYQHTSVLSAEVSLTCYGRRAKLSPRAMAPSTSKMNSGLANPRWWIHTGSWRKYRIGQQMRL